MRPDVLSLRFLLHSTLPILTSHQQANLLATRVCCPLEGGLVAVLRSRGYVALRIYVFSWGVIWTLLDSALKR